ncbi:SDR family NAD(P)-dependent oxidoreductase [Paenibacillus sp. NFR01]|uniref:SDR family NAD(P)-dependent oxidoreductase n=1 Tax=Paenibacillus sp. NFR01 TaxID=1566279 RepID=UPI000B80707B|nr:SDR family NAD(P)-dependent oxidoreductase [Paenibacillus sp. NFR01]
MKRVAVVTGADRGLGFFLTRVLLENKYTVFAGKYDALSLQLQTLKEAYEERLHLIPLDIGSSESVKQAVRSIAGSTGHVDLVINNAGILHKSDCATLLVDMDVNAMAEVYNVNTLGALRVSNAMMGLLMMGRQKLIVNISSEAGSIGRNQRINMYGYCMSKAALNMQSSLIHNHIKNMGGQVMVFHPGWLQTYMHGEVDAEAPITPEESAYKVVGLVLKHKQYIGDEPAYLDLDGNPWPW